jgi:hypothetical protein
MSKNGLLWIVQTHQEYYMMGNGWRGTSGENGRGGRRGHEAQVLILSSEDAGSGCQVQKCNGKRKNDVAQENGLIV